MCNASNAAGPSWGGGGGGGCFGEGREGKQCTGHSTAAGGQLVKCKAGGGGRFGRIQTLQGGNGAAPSRVQDRKHRYCFNICVTVSSLCSSSFQQLTGRRGVHGGQVGAEEG